MKKLIVGLCSIVLVGCSGGMGDLEAFVTETKTQHVPYIPPLKSPPKFEHVAYQAELLRSPFVPPQRELTAELIDTSMNCIQPDLSRRKSRLETFALDSLNMRGTLTQNQLIWALVQTLEGDVYRLGLGDYLGLYHGRITKLSDREIEITELIPDGSGCWVERASSMELTGA